MRTNFIVPLLLAVVVVSGCGKKTDSGASAPVGGVPVGATPTPIFPTLPVDNGYFAQNCQLSGGSLSSYSSITVCRLTYQSINYFGYAFGSQLYGAVAMNDQVAITGSDMLHVSPRVNGVVYSPYFQATTSGSLEIVTSGTYNFRIQITRCVDVNGTTYPSC